jgi:hypothetical protein
VGPAKVGPGEAPVRDLETLDPRRGNRFGAKQLPSKRFPGDSAGWLSSELPHSRRRSLGRFGDVRRNRQVQLANFVRDEGLIVEAAPRLSPSERLQISPPVALHERRHRWVKIPSNLCFGKTMSNYVGITFDILFREDMDMSD